MNDMSNTMRFSRALRPRRAKGNVCKTMLQSTKDRKIAAIEAHLERHPTDEASRAHLAKIAAKAAIQPPKQEGAE